MKLSPLLCALWFLLPGCVRFGFGTGGEPGTEVEPDGGIGAGARPSIGTSSDGSTADPLVPLIVGVQGQAGSYLRRLGLDTGGTGGVTLLRTLRLDGVEGSKLRGLSALPGGRLLAGSGTTAVAELVDPSPLRTAGTVTFKQGAVTNLHGVCVLANGHLIVGEYGMGTGNSVAEYALQGGQYVQLRAVYSTILPSGSLSHCAAPPGRSDELYLTDYAGTTDLDGDVVRVVLQGGAWKVTHRFDTSAFGVATYGPDHQSAVYSFVLHADGRLYIFPLRRFGKRLRRLIRCSTPDISAPGCVELGQLPPDTSTQVSGPDAIQGAAQLPGERDLVFATNRRIYRYELESDTWTALFDMWGDETDLQTAAGQPDSMAQVRNLVVGR